MFWKLQLKTSPSETSEMSEWKASVERQAEDATEFVLAQINARRDG